MWKMTCLSASIIWILIILAFDNICMGQSYWKRTYSLGCIDNEIFPNSDGNFIIAGYTSSIGGRIFVGFQILKIKPNGDMVWLKSFGEIFRSIIPTSDGNFLLGGNASASGSGNSEFLVVKFNPDGDTLWTKTYGGINVDEFQSMLPISDGGFILAGSRSPSIGGSQDILLIRIKANGDTLWTKILPGINKVNAFKSIIPTSDGHFLLVGFTYPYNTNDNGIRFLKISFNGDSLWTNTYHGMDDNYFPSILPLADGNFFLAGNAHISGEAILLFKINAHGDTLWTKAVNGIIANDDQSIFPAADGNFFLTGYKYLGYGLFKITPAGDTLWTKTFNYDNINAILPTSDGNYLLAGTALTSGGYNGIWFAKINSHGDTLWSRTYDDLGTGYFQSIFPKSDGNFFLTGNMGVHPVWLRFIIADQYAFKNQLFTFKIPIGSSDSLNFSYTPLKTPSGMSVSLGGTIFWTPATDSVCMDHIEYLVTSDSGRKDTLAFNAFVNYTPPALVKPSHINITLTKPFEIITTESFKNVKFSCSSTISLIYIYDVNGRMVDRITPSISSSGAFALWPSWSVSGNSRFSSGKYFAKIADRENVQIKPFLYIR